MNETPAKLSSRSVHRGRVVNLDIDTVRFPDGSVGELEMMRHSGAAAVLPLISGGDDPTVLLIRQYRYATGGYIYEVPAGRPSEVGEDWELCARRELEEETGYRAAKLERLTSIWTTPGFTDEVIHLFVATDLRPGDHARDEDEFMEIEEVPFSRALQMIRDGEIRDAKSICTLLFAAQFYLDR
jgi:ADP-ribose pyrophosphatase